MKKNYTLTGVFLIFGLLTSCSSDNGSEYTPLATQVIADAVETNQNASVVVNIFSNDVDVPSNGILTVTNPSHGLVEIQTGSTANTILDDTVLYTPSNDYYGTDTFQYTICSASNAQDCVSGTVTVTVLPMSPVNYSLTNIPYATLSEYNFFSGNMADQIPVYGVIPYEPISTLFTDYAHKKRFVWMPQGVNAQYVNDYSVLDFPIGTILIKSFYYENVLPDNTTRIIETRLMIRKENEWVFANYIWNDEQTEAVMDNVGGYTLVEWMQNGETLSTNYRIPSESECFTCHKIGATNTPIGPKPQNLNKIYGYDSGSENQLEKLATMGYLNSDYPTDIETVVNWEDTSQPLDLRVRSYLDINCAHCHSDDRHCNYRPMRFAFNESWDEANLGVCVEPQELFDGLNYIVSPNNINRSMLYFRVSTTLAQRRMPLLGRTLVHEEAVALIEDWINSLTTTCD